MNEAILKLVQGEKSSYPHELEKQYPRVLGKIVELWDTPQIDAYFVDLLVDKRGGRQGFPAQVASDIYRLSKIHERTHPRDNGPADPWGDVMDMEKQGEFERLGYKRTPKDFMRAVESGDEYAIGLFLSSGMDVDSRDERGWTPLMISAFNGNEKIAELLIRCNANVHARDNAGYGPIHWAAFNGYTKVINLMLERQADVNARSQHGWTPLLQAATRGHLAACRMLISSGANVNLSSDDGWTPLHKACNNGHIEVVRLLLAANADPLARYQDGSTPLSLAEKSKHGDIAALLRAE
jgi:uncharacterized protein